MRKTNKKFLIPALSVGALVLAGAAVGAINTTTASAASDEIMVSAASVRYVDSNYVAGVKFQILLNKSAYTEGSTEIGAKMIPAYYLGSDKIETTNAEQLASVTATELNEEYSETQVEAIVYVYNIPEVNYGTDLKIAAYATNDGDTIYSEEVTCTLAEVAQASVAANGELTEGLKGYYTFGVYVDGKETANKVADVEYGDTLEDVLVISDTVSYTNGAATNPVTWNMTNKVTGNTYLKKVITPVDVDTVTVKTDLSEGVNEIPAETAEEVFGAGATITGAYLATDTACATNLYNDDNLDLTTGGAGEYKIVLQSNDNEYATVNAIAATEFIENLTDLQALKTRINANYSANGGVGGYYLMTANIDATGVTFSGGWGMRYINRASDITNAINNKQGFNGVFNGQGYTISNATFGQGGLFGALVNATVKNVNFTNAYLDGKVQTIGTSSKGQSPLFAQVVFASTVQNCTIDVEYSDDNTEIGVFGYAASNSSVFKDMTITYKVSSTSHRLFLKQIWADETTGKNATFENIKLYYKGTKTDNYFSLAENWATYFTRTNVTNEQYVAE